MQAVDVYDNFSNMDLRGAHRRAGTLHCAHEPGTERGSRDHHRGGEGGRVRGRPGQRCQPHPPDRRGRCERQLCTRPLGPRFQHQSARGRQGPFRGARGGPARQRGGSGVHHPPDQAGPGGGGHTDPTTTTPTTGTTGTTWIVHIDNSNYKGFPPSPARTMPPRCARPSATTGAAHHHEEGHDQGRHLDRFFNIELRDLVRTNQVNTILVWYSGHGRNVSGKAYWVPVDAKKDDVYSYFNYGSLKAQMQNYSETVGNTVVVSDAAAVRPPSTSSPANLPAMSPIRPQAGAWFSRSPSWPQPR